MVGAGGGLTVVELVLVAEEDLVAEDDLVVEADFVVVVVLVVEDDLLVEEDEETVLEDDEPEPEPGLGNVDPMSPQRTLLLTGKIRLARCLDT